MNIVSCLRKSYSLVLVTSTFWVLFFSSSVHAMNGQITYQAKIIKPDSSPLEEVSVNFRFTVLDPVGSCVLYVEEYSAINMSQSGGLVSFALGNGTRSYPVSGTSQTFQSTFDNSVASFSCQSAGVYNPASSDTRKILMQFNDGGGWQTLPAMNLNAVPYAMYTAKSNDSRTLNGKADTAFVEKSTLAALTCDPVTQAIAFNGVSFSCITVGSGSGITSITTSGTVLTTGGTASAAVISISAVTMSQDGYLSSLDYAEFKAKLSASQTQIVNTLGYSPVSAAAVTSQISASNLSGDVSGTISSNSVVTVGGKTSVQVSTSVDDTLAATASNTANAIVKRSASGNFTANDIYANAAKVNYIDIYKPSTSFNISLQTPTSLSTNYVLFLPTTSGTTGQLLSTDGSGNLSWVSPTTGSVVSVSATAPLASSGGVNPTISISQATSSTNGYLSTSDWNTFNNKQAAASAAIIATLGFTPADNAASGTYMQKANNLSDLTNSTTARTNLGLGTLATANSIDLGSASATGVIADARLATQSDVASGVQYTKVTVDGKGRVTSGAFLSSSDVTTALGYTPATAATLVASFVQKSGDTMTGLLSLPTNGLVVGSNEFVVSATNVGIGVLNPTAALQLKAGTTTNAPLRLTSGTLLSSAQSGTVEYDGSLLYFTDGSNTRRAIATNSTPGSFDNTSSIANLSGNITLSPNNITGSVIVNSSHASISSGTGSLVVNGGVGIAGNINAGGHLNVSGSATIGQSLQLSSMTSGSLLFAGANGLVSQDNSNLFWDGANKRLGIGTTSPLMNLEVSGSAAITNPNGGLFLTTSGAPSPSGSNKFWLMRANADSSPFNSNSNSLSLEAWAGVSLTRVMTLASSGNVGVGISAPSEKLHVAGRVVANEFNYVSGDTFSYNSDAVSNYGLKWSDESSGTVGPTAYLSGFGGVKIFTNSSPRLTVANSGNVGIGTSTPDSNLNIEGSGTVVVKERSAGTSAAARAFHQLLRLESAQEYGWDLSTNLSLGNDEFSLRSLSASGTVSRFTVLPSGKVGIGTSTPAVLLQLSSDDNSELNVTNRASSGLHPHANISVVDYKNGHFGAAGINFAGARGTEASPSTLQVGDYLGTLGFFGLESASPASFKAGALIGAIATGTFAAGNVPTALSFQTGASVVAERMRITSSGAVGIGTQNPYGNLEVSNAVTSQTIVTFSNGDASTMAHVGLELRGAASDSVQFIDFSDSTAAEPTIDYRHRIGAAKQYLTFISAGYMSFTASGSERFRISSVGNVGIGLGAANATAKLELGAGTASVAPLRFTSGTLLASPLSGVMEYDGSQFYLTDETNTRRSIATGSSAGTIDNVNNINSASNITMMPTGSVIVSSTTASTDFSTGAFVVRGGMGVAGDIFSSGTIVTSSNIQGASITATNGISTNVIQGNTNLLLNPNSGNVGIGLSVPTQPLHVSGTTLFGTTSGFPAAFSIFDGLNADGLVNVIRKYPAAAPYAVGLAAFAQFAPQSNTSNNSYGIAVGNAISILSGVNATGTVNPMHVIASRNRYAGSADAGTLALLTGIELNYGHENVDAVSPTTTAVVGIRLRPQLGSGQITELRDLYLSTASGVSGTAVNRWSIYQEDVNAKNYFAGSIGIGTATPATHLHVRAASAVIRVDDSTGTNAGFVGSYGDSFQIGVNRNPSTGVFTDSVKGAAALALAGNASGSTMLFYTSAVSGAAPTERLRISEAGNIGISAINPTVKLQIGTAGAATLNEFYISGQYGSFEGAYLGNYSSNGGAKLDLNSHSNATQNVSWRIAHDTDSYGFGNLIFALAGTQTDRASLAYSEKMRIDSSGNVGIGTASPGYTLDVSGTLRVTGTAYTNGGYTTWTAASDRRLKDIHGSYDRGLADVLDINIIRFQYKASNTMGLDSSKEFVGVTAQNLQMAIPEAVTQETNGQLKGYLTINTTPVLWTLVNAVKELYNKFLGHDRQLSTQSRKIANVDAKVQQLESENIKLKQENSAIKTYICSKDRNAQFCQ